MKFIHYILLSSFLLIGSLWNISAMAQSACVPQVITKTSLMLTWDVPTQPNGVILTGYILERQMDSEPWLELPPPSIFENMALDSGLQVWHSYFYRLRFTGLVDGAPSTSSICCKRWRGDRSSTPVYPLASSPMYFAAHPIIP